MPEVITHTHCIHCGDPAPIRLKGYDRVPLLKCRRCRLVFAAQIPSGSELSAYYAHYGQQHHASPLTRIRYRQWLNAFAIYRRTGRILDIGCGVGFFLEEASAAGWEVFGTEFSDGLVRICRDKHIRMHQGPLDETCFAGLAFDVVVWIEVIEHINDPNRDLAQIFRLLRPGGLLFITTPNFNSVERRLLGERFNVIDWPEHLTYYTPATLRRVLMASGFRKKKITTTGISVTRLRGSLTGRTEPVTAATSADESIRKAAARNPLIGAGKYLINLLLNLTRSGLSMKGWFEKSP